MKACIFLVAFLFASAIAVAVVAGDNEEGMKADMTETSHASSADTMAQDQEDGGAEEEEESTEASEEEEETEGEVPGMAPEEGLPVAPTPAATEEQQDAMDTPEVAPAGKSRERYGGDKMAARPLNHYGKMTYNSKGMTVGPYGVSAPYNNAHRQAEVNRLAESVGAGTGAAEHYGVPGTGRYYGYANYGYYGYPYHGYPYRGYSFHYFRNPYLNPPMPYYG